MNYSLILLCAGSGKRTGLKYNKIFYKINNQTVYEMNISHFLEDNRCKQIIVVTKENEIEDIKKLVSDSRIEYVFGGQERQDSVYEGLQKVKEDYVFIHDGARPFLDEEIIKRNIQAVREYQACVAGMPVKDTIKISDEEEFAAATPDRSKLWMIQTPQTFSYELIYQAYRVLITSEENTAEPEQTLPYDSLLNKQKVKKLQENRGQVHVTDDAMVVELLTDIPVKLVRGSYQNIKITTPEDLKIAEALCEKKQ